MMKQKTAQKAKSFAFLAPSLVGLLIFSLLPIVMSFLISLTNWNGLDLLFGKDFFANNFIGLKNYIDILTTKELYTVLGNTLYFIVLYLPLMLVVSLLVATLLNSKMKGKGFFRVVYYIPVLTSWVAASLVWKWFLSSEFGPVNEILSWLGIAGPKWLTDTTFMIPSIVLASVWKDCGFYGLILLSGLQGINTSYYEAARIDGASKSKIFFKITLPLLTPSLFYVIIVSLINAFQLFPQVVVMINNVSTIEAAQVMVERIYTYGFSYYKMGYASALSWILFIIIFIFTVIQMKGQKRWVHYES